jgi:multicomponent Na+:H+ antiporter subunit E
MVACQRNRNRQDKWSSLKMARSFLVRRSWLGAALFRALLFFGLWLILYGVESRDFLVGVLTAIAATWASLLLLPPARLRLKVVALLKLFLRFAIQSIISGIDVARRALDPRMPLHPGFVIYPVRFPRGPTRNTFATLTSLLPGTVPAGDESGQIVYHCLDINQPIVSQLTAEEAALKQALGE